MYEVKDGCGCRFVFSWPEGLTAKTMTARGLTESRQSTARAPPAAACTSQPRIAFQHRPCWTPLVLTASGRFKCVSPAQQGVLRGGLDWRSECGMQYYGKANCWCKQGLIIASLTPCSGQQQAAEVHRPCHACIRILISGKSRALLATYGHGHLLLIFLLDRRRALTSFLVGQVWLNLQQFPCWKSRERGSLRRAVAVSQHMDPQEGVPERN